MGQIPRSIERISSLFNIVDYLNHISTTDYWHYVDFLCFEIFHMM